jgi:hypothetical protein
MLSQYTEALEQGFRFHFISGYYEVLIVLDGWPAVADD